MKQPTPKQFVQGRYPQTHCAWSESEQKFIVWYAHTIIIGKGELVTAAWEDAKKWALTQQKQTNDEQAS